MHSGRGSDLPKSPRLVILDGASPNLAIEWDGARSQEGIKMIGKMEKHIGPAGGAPTGTGVPPVPHELKKGPCPPCPKFR